MWDNSRKNKVEYSGWIVEGGIVVLPTEGYSPGQRRYVKNTNRLSYNDYLPIKKLKEGGIAVALNGKDYKILAQIHTHPNEGDYGPSIPDDYDMYKFAGGVFTIGTGGVFSGFMDDKGNMYNIPLGPVNPFFNGTLRIRDFIE